MNIPGIVQLITELEQNLAGIKPLHDISIKDKHIAVTRRYGKWQRVLSNKTELAKLFHSEGAAGLKAFGYEPRLEFSYPTKAAMMKCPVTLQCIGRT